MSSGKSRGQYRGEIGRQFANILKKDGVALDGLSVIQVYKASQKTLRGHVVKMRPQTLGKIIATGPKGHGQDQGTWILSPRTDFNGDPLGVLTHLGMGGHEYLVCLALCAIATAVYDYCYVYDTK